MATHVLRVALGDGRAGYGNWMEFLIDTVDGSEIRRSSVEVGSLPRSFLPCFLHPRWLFGISSINSTWAVLLTSFSIVPTQTTTALARNTWSEIWVWSERNWIHVLLKAKGLLYMETQGLKPSANQGAFVLACCWDLFLQKRCCPWTVQQCNSRIGKSTTCLFSLQGGCLISNRCFFGLQRCFFYMLGLHWIFGFKEVPA